MKKLFLMLIMPVICTTINAQNRKIVVDNSKDSIRVIEAQGIKVGGFTATKILFIGLQSWVTPNDTSFCLVTNVNTIRPLGAFDDALLLLKIMDDEIVELRSVTSDNNSSEINYANPTVTTTIWKNRISSTYNPNSVNVSLNINYWLITPQIINKLQLGVKKIKIQYRNGVYEKEFKKDEIGKVIHDSYLSELKYIDNNKDDDFRNNF